MSKPVSRSSVADHSSACFVHKLITAVISITDSLRTARGEGQVSRMQSAVDELIIWSEANMNINTRNTKAMVIGPLTRNPPTQIVIGDRTVDRLLQFTLFGVTVNEVLMYHSYGSRGEKPKGELRPSP